MVCGGADDMTFRAEVHATIAEIPEPAWDGLLPGEAESWAYYRAAEATPPEGFALGAISVRAGQDIVAVAPMFRVAYRIDTPLQGALRRAGQWVFEHAPRLVSLPVAGVGSPFSDNCTIGFAAGLDAAERKQAFAVMLEAVESLAAADKSALIAVKSIDGQCEGLAGAFTEHRFARVTSVPLVMLDLPFTSFDDYLASLPAKTRGYFKRKLRARSKVRMEYRTSLAGIEDQVYDLFQSTLKHSKVDYGEFEQVPASYFSRVLEAMGEGIQCQLWWLGSELVGFQFSLVGRDRIVTKHIGMKYPQAKDLNLYFLNWLSMIEFAIARGIPRIEMGATTYATKLLFGGYLSQRWLYFRFRGDVANFVFQPLAPLFDFERHDPELKALRSRTDMPEARAARG